MLVGQRDCRSAARSRSTRTPTCTSSSASGAAPGKMNEYSAFVQDQWRVTPTLTVNAGLRYDLQMPFTPIERHPDASTLADACGTVGHRRRRRLPVFRSRRRPVG